MIPVLTTAEMRAVDEAAPEPVEVLIERAGAAVARSALRMLGGQAYGRRVAVVAGKGNNGADGRVAARRLELRGARVNVVDPGVPVPAGVDLVIDAAYGTGFRGSYTAPDPGGAPVLAVDVPSGVNGDTGEVCEGAVWADATVTFAALKPGHLLGEGRLRCGPIELADIGLEIERVSSWLVEDADVAGQLPRRSHEAHKWQTAVFVAAGSPGMMGAPLLVARGAMRAGAGYVRLGVPGADVAALAPGHEAVAVRVPAHDWAPVVLTELERCKALVVGPGLGRGDEAARAVRRLVAASPVPVVVDADGLNVLGEVPGGVLTPHDKEFERLAGRPPGPDRMADVRSLASSRNATVLLKGSTTLVAEPDGTVLFAATGTPALATAGTGDVLAGVVGAFLARGLPPLRAAAFAAHVHGAAAHLGYGEGLVAGDLPELIARWLSVAVGRD
ncbi:MAG TPA: NAD(P)H-hydrate dehydratase [Acidimicrobiales bacterium]|nr:NAD(P)H-hydrate dehydratase [Acidimicrobiales bacterium]